MRRTMVSAEDVSVHFGIEVRGTTLVETRYRNGVPRNFEKPCADAHAVTTAFDKRVRTKLKEGFVHRDLEGGPGALCFEAWAEGGGVGGVLDLSPDGKWVIGASFKGQATACSLHLWNVETGAGREVFQRSDGNRQFFLHAARFDARAESVVFQLNDDTLRLDLANGTTKTLASYRERQSSHFNPCVVRPLVDAAHRRCVVFDANDEVKVVELETERVLCTISAASPTSECRAAALSVDGKRLALYRPSRFVVYGHADAREDTSRTVEVYEVDGGKRLASFEASAKLQSLWFGPGDSLFLQWDYTQGPVSVSYDGQEHWRVRDPSRNDRLATLRDLALSPDQTRVAIAADALSLTRLDGQALPDFQPLAQSPHIVQLVRFSADGTRLASWSSDGVIQVRRV